VAVVPPYGGAQLALRVADGGAEGARAAAPRDALETIIPKPGGRVVLLAGEGAGSRGVLTAIHVDAYSCDVTLDDGRALSGKAYAEVTRAKAA
jgi:hypothetical protein